METFHLFEILGGVGPPGSQGVQGRRGKDGSPGSFGDKGNRGPAGTGDFGFMLAVHSQQKTVPECPPGMNKMWDTVYCTSKATNVPTVKILDKLVLASIALVQCHSYSVTFKMCVI